MQPMMHEVAAAIGNEMHSGLCGFDDQTTGRPHSDTRKQFILVSRMTSSSKNQATKWTR